MKYFNSNETLEMCDVHISENGKMVVATKSYHSDALERLGKPEKAIRGSVRAYAVCSVRMTSIRGCGGCRRA